MKQTIIIIAAILAFFIAQTWFMLSNTKETEPEWFDIYQRQQARDRDSIISVLEANAVLISELKDSISIANMNRTTSENKLIYQISKLKNNVPQTNYAIVTDSVLYDRLRTGN